MPTCWITYKKCMLLLSRFSRVRLCATPETAAHQAPPSLGFSRQEHWSGLLFPSPMHESEKWKWSHSVVSDSSWPPGLQPTRLLNPWDFPGKSMEWGAIAFSEPELSGPKCHLVLSLETRVCRYRIAWTLNLEKYWKPKQIVNFKFHWVGISNKITTIFCHHCFMREDN